MRKLISFALYGENPKYVYGMFRNIELREEFYPDWDIMIFHDNSVPESDIEKFADMGAILRNVTAGGIYPASWRFLAYDEPHVSRFISRDADSRISEREADAVKEWEESGKTFHVMRDHPHHGAPPDKPMLGGMWGMTKDLQNPLFGDATLRQMCILHQGSEKNSSNRDEWFWTDMNFLRDFIYHPSVNSENTIIHASQDYMYKVRWQNEPWAKDFPTPRNKHKNFVGEVFEVDAAHNERRAWQYREI